MIFGSAPKDCIWMETGKPILAQATQFAQAQTRVYNVRPAVRMTGFEDSLGVSLRILKIKIPTRYIYIYTLFVWEFSLTIRTLLMFNHDFLMGCQKNPKFKAFSHH